jgi:hypothetical protein
VPAADNPPGISIKGNETMKFAPITPEHIAHERAKLDELEKQLKASRAKLDAFELEAVKLAASFEQVIVPDAPQAPAPSKAEKIPASRKPPVNRLSSPKNNNLRYTQEQIETLTAAHHDDLAELAKAWDRTLGALEKKREELLADARRETKQNSVARAQVNELEPVSVTAPTPTPVSEETPGPVEIPAPIPPVEQPVEDPELAEPVTESVAESAPEGLAAEQQPVPSEDLPISPHRSEIDEGVREQARRVEQHVRPADADVFDKARYEWRPSRPNPKPGIPVRGLMDNGPLDKRTLDPEAFRSKE